MREIEQIKEIVDLWENSLLASEKKYIHYRSITNFIFHFENLPNIRIKETSALLLSNYIDEVENNNFDYKDKRSYELAKKYMNEISEIYKSNLGFKSFIDLRFIILFSILGDGILYFSLKNKTHLYIPIISLCLFTYYLYTKIFFEKRKMVYGIFY